MCSSVAKPFLKWAGGKGQLIATFDKMFPDELVNGEIETYIEPFVGGGAVLFHVLQNYNIKKAYINDINNELINCYTCIKTNVDKVIVQLQKLEQEYFASLDKTEYYYKVRDRYNEIKLNGHEDYEKCADFIFLNRTCFNGLYRVNKEGKFNVPHGKYKNPLICDKENLKLCSSLLKKVDISYGDYQKVLDKADKKTFVYFDPPYRPLLENNSFVSYDKAGFGDKEQKLLAEKFGELNKKNSFLMLSNSDPKNTDKSDNFFDDLYKDFEIERVCAKRMINCQADKRGDITEIVVKNYKKEEKTMVNCEKLNKKIKRGNNICPGIITFKLQNFEVQVYQGTLSKFDIIVKYKTKDLRKTRTPKHIHWVVDLLLKMQGAQQLTTAFLNQIEKYWRTCSPLTSNQFNSIKTLVDKDFAKLNVKNYDKLNQFGEFDIEFLVVLFILLIHQEKTNNNQAFMFKNVIDKLLQPKLDIYSIVAVATHNGR